MGGMELPPPFDVLARADAVSFGRVGAAATEPETSRAFEAARPLAREHRAAIAWMLAYATPAGRCYAACLAGQLGAEEHRAAWTSLIDERVELSVAPGGCTIVRAPLGDFATSMLETGGLLAGLPSRAGDAATPAPAFAARSSARRGAWFDEHRGKLALAFWALAALAWIAWRLAS